MRKRKSASRSFEIHAAGPRLGEAGFVRIATGRNAEKAVKSIFIDRDSFSVVAGIVKKHYTKYDHYEMKNISRTTGTRIAANLREAAEALPACKGKDILNLLEYKGDKSQGMIDELVNRRAPISKMLAGIADYLENAYDADEWICVIEG